MKKDIQYGGFPLVAKESYNRPKDRAKTIKDPKGNTWTLVESDPKYNSRDFVVYKNDKGQHYLGVRGTDVFKGDTKKFQDLGEDLLIALGADKTGLSARNRKANNLLEKLRADVGDDSKIMVTGHSLGASVASNLVKKNKGKIGGEVYNPGSTPLSIVGNLQRGKPVKNLEIYSTGVDPLSASAFYSVKAEKKERVPLKEGVGNPHSLEHFEDLDPGVGEL